MSRITYNTKQKQIIYDFLLNNKQILLTCDEISDALQPAFAKLSELELRPSQIPAHTQELKDAINEVLKELWIEHRGIKLESIALNPHVLPYDDKGSVNKMEDA